MPERVHEALVKQYYGGEIVGHLSQDSTAIAAREKPKCIEKASTAPHAPKKHGRPKKGQARPKPPTRLEKQLSGMNLTDMLDDLPKACDRGTTKNSQGYKSSWTGYKLHIDAADGAMPISCVLTSASNHDSQSAIPLAVISAQRVTNCYDLMDSAYDAKAIYEHSRGLGHVPLIDTNPGDKALKQERENESQRRKIAGYQTAEERRYSERTTIERVNARLKDEFGGRTVRMRGHAKVMGHLMFGIVVLTADQLMKFVT